MRRAAGALLLAMVPAAGLAAGAFHDSPAGPRALPGDVLPPFGMVDAAGTLPPPPPLPPGVHLPGPGDPPESTAPGLPLAAATRAAAAAVAACERGGSRVGATVIDSAGEARAMLSADGSNGSHVFVAMRKAEVALAFARPSSQVAAAAARDPGVAARVGPAMFVEGGAVPIFRRGKVIGALGVSGAGGAVIGRADELCALAGLKALGRR